MGLINEVNNGSNYVLRKTENTLENLHVGVARFNWIGQTVCNRLSFTWNWPVNIRCGQQVLKLNFLLKFANLDGSGGL